MARAEESEVHPLFQYLLSWFPMLLLIGVWVFFMRQMQSGGGRAMGFGKSRARLLTEKQGRITFEDVAGIDEAKSELEEIVEFLRDPQKFQRLGGKIPKGVLLVGPPGTGKTLLARAIAGEANVPFFTISGSDFVEMFVGVGASPRARHVRAGQEERPLHHLHRRDRRRRPPPRRRPGRRQRRARADPEPDARGDGRLRVQRGRHPHRRHQPPGRARPGAAAPRPLRPAGRGAEPGTHLPDLTTGTMELIDEKISMPLTATQLTRPRLLLMLERSLQSCNATIISGRAGTGKSALALDFARRLVLSRTCE